MSQADESPAGRLRSAELKIESLQGEVRDIRSVVDRYSVLLGETVEALDRVTRHVDRLVELK